ncbi:hypothetical protein LVD15_19075 [Fulvivirga maritima]|uniref:hypothetical protein n=1 Tax=Fulvivirga maritima TaxID=2904247 RepID=UPI001F24FA3F|nr:hypothetical protein [Fulvivirga maritima]UII25389.1 hypothetical protein LVD15_19075 [Fulvivirga maritima]
MDKYPHSEYIDEITLRWSLFTLWVEVDFNDKYEKLNEVQKVIDKLSYNSLTSKERELYSDCVQKLKELNDEVNKE